MHFLNESTLSNDSFAYNPSHDSECGLVDLLLKRYAISPLILFCVFGNMFNLIIHRFSYANGDTLFPYFKAKVIVNSIFVFSRVFEMIHAWGKKPSQLWEPIFWMTRPYMIAIANISGTVSIWLSAIISLKTVFYLLYPLTFRCYCTKRFTLICLFSVTIFATLSQAAFIYLRTPIPISGFIYDDKKQCFDRKTYYSLELRDQSDKKWWKAYTIEQGILGIFIPIMIMSTCTAIVCQKARTGVPDPQQKRVLYLLIATTFSHILFDGPAILSHFASAIDHPNPALMWCVMNHISNFLSLINATIPFLFYFVCFI
ncbi:unnamed protein product, partial [Mesorhabditis belari]|uniref:G-protein coupled receptors family 1 profile domain-containing protein n=1 Tax=Mesorhabditis belari TaxID=2138241 RepID=A0AAF3EKS5_9BILA